MNKGDHMKLDARPRVPKLRYSIAALAVALVVTACGGGTTSQPSSTPAAPAAPVPPSSVSTYSEDDVPGVSKDEIFIAETNALSGNFAAVTGPYVASALAVFAETNDAGGVLGRAIRWEPVDDGFDLTRATTQASRFVTSDNVFAAALPLGTAPTIAKAQVYAAGGLPYLTLGTSRSVVTPKSFGCSTSYYTQARVAVEYAVESLNLTRIGYLVWATNDGQDVADGTIDGLKAMGLEPVAEVTYAPGTTDFTGQFATLSSADVEAIVVYGSTPDTARVAIAKQRAGLDAVTLISPTPAFDANFLTLSEGAGEGTIVASPFLGLDSGAPGIEAYLALLKEKSPDVTATFWGLFGYHCARVVVTALEAAGSELTRDGFVAGLAGLTDFDSGVHGPVSLVEGGDTRGGTMIYRVEGGKYVQISDGFQFLD